MRQLMIIISLLVLAGVYASPSFSSSCNREKGYPGHFNDMDMDGDDLVSREEFKKKFPKTGEDTFNGIDKNKDGAIDHDEWHYFKAHHGYAHKHED